ncbi:ribosomal protein S6 kinase alpha-1 isoform X1, partial [Tachysurus ichikawai]
MEGEKEKRKFSLRQLLTLYLFKRHQNKALATVAEAACPRSETGCNKSSIETSTASAKEQRQWT